MLQVTNRSFHWRLFSAFLAATLLLSACAQTAVLPTLLPTATQANPLQPTGTTTPTTVSSTQTPGTTQTAASSDQQGDPSVSLDVTGMAAKVTSEVIPAVGSADGPHWMAMPAYMQLTLQGYPVSNSSYQPRVFVFPVKNLDVNEAAGKAVKSLQALLQDQQVGQDLPFLPLTPDVQALHARVTFLDFKDGSGVSFLTQFGSGLAPINNHALIYTFQGLTGDGQFYVSAVFPLNLPGLPEDSLEGQQSQPPAIQYPQPPAGDSLTDEQIQAFDSQYRQYIIDTVIMLNNQPENSFIPELSRLDAMVRSLEIK